MLWRRRNWNACEYIHFHMFTYDVYRLPKSCPTKGLLYINCGGLVWRLHPVTGSHYGMYYCFTHLPQHRYLTFMVAGASKRCRRWAGPHSYVRVYTLEVTRWTVMVWGMQRGVQWFLAKRNVFWLATDDLWPCVLAYVTSNCCQLTFKCHFACRFCWVIWKCHRPAELSSKYWVVIRRLLLWISTRFNSVCTAGNLTWGKGLLTITLGSARFICPINMKVIRWLYSLVQSLFLLEVSALTRV